MENPTSVCVGDVRQPAANQANTHDTLDDHPSALNEIEPPNSETASNKSTLSEMLVREVEVEVEEAPPYIPSRSSAPSGANPPHLEISSSPYNIRISPCRVSIELEADELELSGTQQATRGSGTRRNRRDRRGGKRGAWSDWMSMPGVGWVAWRFALTLLVCHAVLVWNQTDDFSEVFVLTGHPQRISTDNRRFRRHCMCGPY